MGGGGAVGVALGVGAFAGVLFLLSRRATAATPGSPRDRSPRSVAWGTGWVWPVPTLVPPAVGVEPYDAAVSSGFDSTRGARQHTGLDVMYRRHGRDDRWSLQKFPPNVRQADGFASTPGFFAPPGTPILAARAGRVWRVEERDDGGGITVVLDHGKPWATYYTHLATTKLAPHQGGRRIDAAGEPQAVAAGEVIGTMGGNKGDASRVRHLHFEAWYEGTGPEASVDAKGAGVMPNWRRESWAPSSL